MKKFVVMFAWSALLISDLNAQSAPAKSIILFIGDGMGLNIINAAKIYAYGVEGSLNLEKLPHTALVHTYCSDELVTDSAAAATTLASGEKTNFEVVGEDVSAVVGKSHGKALTTIIDLASKAGKSTGIVTNTRITDGTPAGFYAHTHNRDLELDIALQLRTHTPPIDVVMGGGRRQFLPTPQMDPESKETGLRQDGRDLTSELATLGYSYIWRTSDFDKINPDTTKKLLALFSPSNMAYEIDRQDDVAGEPSLTQMVIKALSILQKNPKGYFLIVENGLIDKAAHLNDSLRTITETLELDRAIAATLNSVDRETLILVTADHDTSGLNINGYLPISVKGKELLGSINEKRFGTDFDHSIISWASGPGLKRKPRTDKKEREHVSPSLFYYESGLHTANDVILAATGPGSHLVRGFLDNTDVFRIMVTAAELK